MRLAAVGPTPTVSVVIPVVSRPGDLPELYRAVTAELARLGELAEVIFVVGDRWRLAEGTRLALSHCAPVRCTVLRIGGALGESAALAVGLRRARGRLVMTLAPRLEIEPSGLSRAIEAAATADLVVGRRTPLPGRTRGRLFHWLLSRAAAVPLHDLDCGFRLMTREVAKTVQLYGHRHRFLPALARQEGFSVREIELPLGPEGDVVADRGSTVGSWLDLFTISFLGRFTRRPLRFFGAVGVVLFLAGFVVDAIVALQKVLGGQALADRPALLLGTLLIVLGVQVFSLGLVGEIIIFTHARHLREYRRSGGEAAAARDDTERSAATASRGG